MKLEDLPTPEPAGSQVLVRIAAAGVNPVDTYMRSGNHAHAPRLPYTPGKDGAGVVEKVGPEAGRFSIGGRVYTAGSITGTYAEFALCEETELGILPENVTFEQGAGIWTPYATSYRALFQKARLTQGEIVLVHGASGAVGLAAVQWAKHLGAIVIGTASSADGRQLVKNNRADAVFDHTDPGHFEEIREFTNGKGVDVIVEMLANANLERDFECLAMFGRIVVVGNRGSIQFTPRLAMTKDATIFGMSLFNSTRPDVDDIHAAIFDGLSNGFLSPIVRESIPLSDAARSHREVIDTKAFGKIVLVP